MTRRSVAPSRVFAAALGRPVAVVEAVPAPAAPLDTAIGEVLGYRWAWLGHLPVPAALVCRLGAASVWLRTARHAPPAPAEAVSFVGGELVALGVAAELERAYPATLRTWVASRRAGTLPALTVADAMGEVAGARSAWAERWTCAQVLRRLGLALDGVRL